jgi:hypothetical protein
MEKIVISFMNLVLTRNKVEGEFNKYFILLTYLLLCLLFNFY